MRKFIIFILLIGIIACSMLITNHHPAPSAPTLAKQPAIVPGPQPSNSIPAPDPSKLDALLNKDAKIDERVPPDITSALPRVKSSDDYARLVAGLLDSSDDDNSRNEIINLLRRSRYAELPTVLDQVLKNPVEKPRFKAFAAQHLGAMLPELTPERRPMLTNAARVFD